MYKIIVSLLFKVLNGGGAVLAFVTYPTAVGKFVFAPQVSK